ncbi:hypothetical protein M569_11250, partial [Genlisea aurea]
SRFGDRSTSDVVVRIRTPEGRDDRTYCHSGVLVAKSDYFAERLSDSWPVCQIIDSRNCVEVVCEESDFDYHVAVLRLLYSVSGISTPDLYSVGNALGILRISVELGCAEIASACAGYLECAPWEESEEEEILRVIPNMGSDSEKILARLRPVDPPSAVGIFLSAIRFATSSPPPSMADLKISAQEQLEYMLTADEDAPLVAADDGTRSEARRCVGELLSRFLALLDDPGADLSDDRIEPYLSDLSWGSNVLAKLDASQDFVAAWVESSSVIVSRAATAAAAGRIKVKVLEVAAKVMEAIGDGNVVIPAGKRARAARTWVPFARSVKSEVEVEGDAELWQSMESALVSVILTLPSSEQAEILKEWLEGVERHLKYPDLTEAFEIWCYRSKVARRRLGLV